MINGISLLKKKRFFPKKDTFNRKIVFSPLVLIPLFLVFISSILIKSVQKELLQSDYLNHLFTGLLGYFLAIFISIAFHTTIWSKGSSKTKNSWCIRFMRV